MNKNRMLTLKSMYPFLSISKVLYDGYDVFSSCWEFFKYKKE